MVARAQNRAWPAAKTYLEEWYCRVRQQLLPQSSEQQMLPMLQKKGCFISHLETSDYLTYRKEAQGLTLAYAGVVV